MERFVEPAAGASQDAEDPDLGFTYRRRKNGEVEIRHLGRVATLLRGKAAVDFLAEAENGGAAQQAMARLTGNYKRGNERVARRHPRNRS